MFVNLSNSSGRKRDALKVGKLGVEKFSYHSSAYLKLLRVTVRITVRLSSPITC